MENIKQYAKRSLAMTMAVIMMISAFPLQSFAQTQTQTKKPKPLNYDNEDLNHRRRLNDDKLPVLPARPEEGKTSEKFIEDPAQPAIYTLRTDFKAEKGEKYSVNYQPYVASVGAAAKPEEQAKVNKTIDLPNMAGYKKPEGVKSFTNSYDAIKGAAEIGHQTGKAADGLKYLALREYKYEAIQNNIQVKHVFQNMEDFNKFTNKDGTITKNDGTVIDAAGHETKYDLKDPDQKKKYQEFVRDHETIKILSGNTGSTLEVQPLQENERPGFEPQVEKLKTQVPEDTSEFKIEYRYNRAAYDVVFDTQDGTPLPTRTYYYDQEIPKIDENSIPTKIGCDFLGWKPSRDLEGVDGTKYEKGKIITDANGHAIIDLGNIYYKRDGNKLVKKNGDPVKETNAKDIQLKMPAMKLGNGKSIPREKLTFTAVWKDKDKADYAIQFWVEKADHPENASLLNKYDYMGTRVYEQEPTGKRPELDKEPVKGLKFPDLDQARLNKIWNGAKFNRGQSLYLNKFFVYNEKLTDDENKDPKEPTVIKAVSATGQTVYNIYYDRQVYDLYFTESNHFKQSSPKNTFFPEIYGRDQKKNELVKLGGPGKPYHYQARFNEMMYKWPNDAMQTKGFTEGYQSFGWGPNYASPKWPVHLDTPPYRLNADEFLDMANYDNLGGYTKHIDKGDGTNIDLDQSDFTTLSFGIKQEKASIPHHMDFWMDGFKPGETIIRYDLVRTKADTADLGYNHRYPKITGFIPYAQSIQEGTEEDGRVDSDRIDELNDEREEITPYPGNGQAYHDIYGFDSHVGALKFISVFFNNADDFGDILTDDEGEPITSAFKENGYLQFHYKRNKYPLRFNTDPTKIKDDSAFNPTNQLDTFYRFPLKALSPDVDKDGEYKKVDTKEGPKNLLDDPDNLFKLGLTDLLQKDKNNPNKFFQDEKDHYRVKRPEGLSDQLVFKGWAMDPAGQKMVWKNKDEKMPFHPLNLYAIWDEPDYKWKVTVDPNGGTLSTIKPKDLTTEMKTIKEGDIGREEENTYPVKGYEGEKVKEGTQVFTVVQKQKLKNLPKPERYGYDFLGWEVIRYQKAPGGGYTNDQDTSYRDKYKVPELYSFGTDVVSPVYLKAIWVENKRAEVKVLHYYLKNEKTENGQKLVLDTSKYPNPEPNDLYYKRVGDYVPATGEKQDEHWILATNTELMDKLDDTLKPEYEKYNERVKLNNTFFQSFRVQNNITEGTKENPVYKPNPENIFRFYYRPFRTRNYKVNYIDERGKKEVDAFFKGLDLIDIDALKKGEDYKKADEKGKEAILLEANKANKKKFKDNRKKLEAILDKYKVIDKEDVTSQCRHYDARNYRHIPGWKLASDPQQQLFYDVNENTNEFLGINGTGSNEIYFYYKDARVIEVKNPKDPVPDGYVRVTFKIDDKNKGGVFEDKDGKKVTELHYDVIKGLKSDLLPKPVIWEGGNDAQGKPKKKEANRYYITPDQGKSFKEWDNEKWLNAQTEINRNYTFTAYFDWSGMSTSSKGLVRTEAFKGVDGKWVNDFAPKLSDLKAQLVWKEGNEKKDIPADTKIKFVYKDEGGQETVLTKDEDIYNLVQELNEKDAKQTVRVLNIVAKVTFKGGDAAKAQELPIPITVYKNRYEALNEKGDKPLYLSDAEKKDAKDGGLKDILKDNTENRYIKVTIKPNKDFDNKDNKVYYVNPNAWVDIPKVESTGDSRFTNWTADIADYNEESKENGVFDFAKRHKFTKDTVITPVGAGDVVEQEKGKDKPDVPKTYVKVIVKTTDKATKETAFEKTFWVNPTKDATIPVANPAGKSDQEVDIPKLGKKKVNYVFNQWQKVKAGEADDKLQSVKPEKVELTSHKYTDKVTVIEASYFERFAATPILKPIKVEKLDTPEGKEITDKDLIGKITPPSNKEIESITVVEKPDSSKPGKQEAKVTIKYKDGSTQGTDKDPVVIPVEVHKNIIPEAPGGQRPKDALENYVKVTFTAGTGGTVSGDLVYYVSPEVEVNMTESAGKVTKKAYIGYINGDWDTSETKKLKDTFKAETEFTFNFVKDKDIVEKTDDPNQVIPEGYVKVTFKTDGNGKVDGKDEKIYYVNPKADIKLGKETGDKILVVPTPTANANYVFNGWQEAIDETTPITSERIHVAIFKSGQVTLTYAKGGEDVTGDVPADVTVNYGETVGLANKGTLKKPNHEFAGWKLDDDETIYQPGAQVKLEKARTATAQWKPVNHTVTFDAKGGSKVDSQQVEHGKTATQPKEPKLDGKVFMGWKENASDTSYFDFATPITADKTLIAIWQDSVQKIDENTKVEGEFIKVTFLQGAHGQLVPDKDKQDVKKETVTYKVAKNDTFKDAVKHGLVVPGIVPAKYYKVAEDKEGVPAKHGWDKALDLTLAQGETEKIFTAQYEPIANVIPVDPKVTDEKQIQKEKPEGMVLVDFQVDSKKAYMLGDTKFYVKKDEVVNIKPPLVRRLELGNDVRNDYVFKGWDLTKLNNQWKFKEDTTIDDGTKVKPTITIILPSAGDPEVSVESMTEGATAYLEVTRRGKDPVIIEAVKDPDYGTYFFDMPQELGALKKRDKIKVYAELKGLRSETREYRIK